jgi:hypothetical protein
MHINRFANQRDRLAFPNPPFTGCFSRTPWHPASAPPGQHVYPRALARPQSARLRVDGGPVTAGPIAGRGIGVLIGWPRCGDSVPADGVISGRQVLASRCASHGRTKPRQHTKAPPARRPGVAPFLGVRSSARGRGDDRGRDLLPRPACPPPRCRWYLITAMRDRSSSDSERHPSW